MNDICNELGQNFLEYSYETNSNRAFPDVRDGLKPGQRAILWEMWSKGFTSNRPHIKCAKVSGGVAASFWPHGTDPIYETMAHMAQDWTNNLPEIDWHGNKGNSIIGDYFASSRYTECRLSSATEDGMFVGIEKNNVPMILNFSEDEKWPVVLPAIMPRLLLNGSQGIGITIANCWATFNLQDCGRVIEKYLDSKEVDTTNFYPDFASGGIIINRDELHIIHETGKGRIVLRGQAEVCGDIIRITELPYQVYVEPLIEEIKSLIADETLIEIDDITNKSETGRILIEIKCDYGAQAVLNKLYNLTSLQKTINVNQIGLESKTPVCFTLEKYLHSYIEHNLECIRREAEYDRARAQDRLEIVNGLLKALAAIDDIIKLIKGSKNAEEAANNLIAVYGFSEVQARAIVDMKLGKLANLERIELEKKQAELEKTIKEAETILSSREKQELVFRKRLKDFVKEYGKPRRTQVIQMDDKTVEEEKKEIVFLDENGSGMRRNRAGKGIPRPIDATLIAFTANGTIVQLPVRSIPETARCSAYDKFSKDKIVFTELYARDFIYILTAQGMIKKFKTQDALALKKSGLSIVGLNESDKVVSVFTADNNADVYVLTHNKMALRFNTEDIAATRRAAKGVKAITLKEDDYVENGGITPEDMRVLNVQKRGGKGKRYE